MTDESPSLEDLLTRRLPSATLRDDAAFQAAGLGEAELAATKNAVAALGLAVTSASPERSLRDRLLASAARPGRYGVFADRVARLFDMPIAGAEALLAGVERGEGWMPFLVPGLELAAAPAGPKCEGAMATLVRFQPGTRFPNHQHVGEETMVVLDGGFREVVSGGEEVWRGDEIVRTDSSEHELEALPGVPCIAAVLIFGHTDFR